MSFRRTHLQATMRHELSVESLLETSLQAIAAELAAMPTCRYLRAVWLGGGYGRGEGGVYFPASGDPTLYNDLDFFVVGRGSRGQLRRLDADLRQVSQRWEQRLGIAVDFEAAHTMRQIYRTAKTLMTQEMLHGHVVVYGEDVPADVVRLDPRTIPLTEGLRLLLNRGVGLLLAACEWKKPHPDVAFIQRNLNKAILGIGDAACIAQQQYAWRIEDRVKVMPAELQSAYAQAMAFKACPTMDFKLENKASWETLRTQWLACYLACTQGQLPQRLFGRRSIKQWLRVGLRLKCWWRQPGVHPLAQTLEQLATCLQACTFEALCFENPAIVECLRWWQKFN